MKFTTTLLLSMLSMGAAFACYADNQDLGSQQGFITGGPGTMQEDQNVRDSTQPQVQTDQAKKTDTTHHHTHEQEERDEQND